MWASSGQRGEEILQGDFVKQGIGGIGHVGEKRIGQWMPLIVREAQRIYPTLAPSLRDKVCPGMRAFLARLRRCNVPCGLVTGNLSRIGWCKMGRAGLRNFFRFGAFAEMGPTRGALVGLALARARREGWLKAATPVYLVGDHLNDIRAARENLSLIHI